MRRIIGATHVADPRRTRSAVRLALDAPIERLKGLGPKRAAAWRAAGVATIADLLRVPPRRHARFAAATPIAALEADAPACVRVELVRRHGSGRRGIVATRLDVRDESGEITAILFGPRWLARAFARSEKLLLRGEKRRRGGKDEFLVRAWLHGEELPAEDPDCRAPVLQPHYALPDGIAPRLHRRQLRALLEELAPELRTAKPAWVARAAGEGATLHELLRALHFPRDEAEQRRARRAFALEAAIAIQRRLRAARRSRARRLARPFEQAQAWLADYLALLPFVPTDDQRRALEECAEDLRSPQAMARLLSGDVGSGKSAVAFFPLYVAARAGRQAALLAPTEILARQHEATLRSWLAPAGIAARLHELDAPIVVGTHRLLSAPVRFRDLAAVVVDEQHKFGVKQRWRLLEKGRRPDLLLVSATPIPRTLAHTLFGHLDLSLLAQRPFDARRVTSELLLGEARRELGARLRSELEAGGKAFVVCPAIGGGGDEAPAGRATISAERIAAWLARELPGFPVALLHGRLDPAQKQERLAAFAAGATRALVATVVVEVGIDVPDATLAAVLGAERFGLSQLHQIRGRVGRRGHPAKCLLVSADPSEEARERLEQFTRIDDGFALAELDFARRGPGELLGTKQHGLVAGLYPEALLDPELVALAKELSEDLHDGRKSSPGKPFRGRGVASTAGIW
jgi:ATP-dependent DNA helicase RecG